MIREYNAFSRHPVQKWSPYILLSVASYVSYAEVIGVDEYYIGPSRIRYGA